MVCSVVPWIHEDLYREFQFDSTLIHYLQSADTHTQDVNIISTLLNTIVTDVIECQKDV